jgi:hypothetical protein
MAALSGCGSSDEASYRFRMTVEVATPQGLRTGSSVMEVTARRQSQFAPEARPLVSELRGEAVVVDTPSGPIFALLKLPHNDHTYLQAVTFALAPDLREGGWEPFLKAVKRLGGWFGGAKADLPREDWPLMVRFRDLNDPKSVEQIDPAVTGVRRILVETTNHEVTSGIEQRLRWLGNYPEPSLNPGHGPRDYSLSATLHNYDFRQGNSR